MRAVRRWARGLPRPHTLRARLTVGLVVLLAVSCAAVGVAVVIELNGFLTGRLDEQLSEAGPRFPASLEHSGVLPDDLPRRETTRPGESSSATSAATPADRPPAPSGPGCWTARSRTRRWSAAQEP